MAKTKKPAPEKAPLHSEETGSDDSLSEEEAVLSTPLSQKSASLAKKPTANKAAAEEESEHESDDSDSESEPLVASKQAKGKKHIGNHVIKAETPAKRSTPAKRALPFDAEKSPAAKKERTSGGVTLFQRLWSDEDENILLQGLVDYKAEKGADPMLDTNGFHEFIRSSIHADADRKQMMDKIRRLKKRYETSLGRKKKTLNAHEERANQLSKLIWGPGLDKPAATARKAKAKPKAAASNGDVDVEDGSNGVLKEEVEEIEEDDVNSDACETEKAWKFIGKGSISMGLDENLVNEGLELCSEAIKAEIEENWKQLYLEEAALFARKLDLVREESNLITQALL